MKKSLIAIIIVASVAIAAVGIVGIARDRGSKSDAVASAATPYQAEETSDMLNVLTPASLPSQVKDYEGFRVSFNKENHTPNWVAWELLSHETDGASTRSNKFWQDTDIDGCPTTRDYSKSGYDRGHLCPAADQKWSKQAMSDCFSLANICPQDHALNSGAWSTLEKMERAWAERDSAILIVAGPIYTDSDTRRIGEAGVRVPSAFFKVFAAPYLSSPRAIAFVYPNMTSPGNMAQYVMTVDDVEQLTGFDFFSALPDDIENSIESVASFKEWNR